MQEGSKIATLPAIGKFKIRNGKVFFAMTPPIEGDHPMEIACGMDIPVAESINKGENVFEGYMVRIERDKSYHLIIGISKNRDEAQRSADEVFIDTFLTELNITNKKGLERHIARFYEALGVEPEEDDPYVKYDDDSGNTITFPIDDVTAMKILEAYPDGVVPPDHVEIIKSRKIGRE